MQEYEKFINEVKIFKSFDGKDYSLVDVEKQVGYVIAVFVPSDIAVTGDWSKADKWAIASDLVPQEGETVSGWEYPRFEAFTIDYAHSDYDMEIGIAEAVDNAIQYLKEGKEVSHAA